MKRLYFFELALLSWLGSSLVHAQTPPDLIVSSQPIAAPGTVVDYMPPAKPRGLVLR